MRSTARWATILLLAGLAPAGCGGGAPSGRGPTLAAVPLIAGTRVVASVRRCDGGANPYCAVQLVVVGHGYSSAGALVAQEARHLKRLGWSTAQGDFGTEGAADSPGHGLRLTYAPDNLDLEGIDLGWITRAPVIGRALSAEMFARAPAMSLMLQDGAS